MKLFSSKLAPILVGTALALGCKSNAVSEQAAAPPVSQPSSERAAAKELQFLPYYDDPSFNPHWLNGDAPKLEGFHSIDDFELTNQDGEKVTPATFEGKIYITDFFFTTCPGICVKMTASMGELQKTFLDDDEISFLSHSATPDIDTPEVLKKYAERYGVVSGKWHLVTGTREHIYQLGRKQYFVEEDLGKNKTDDDFLHTENFLLIDKQRRIRGIYNGLNRSDMKQLVADVKTLKSEPG